MPTIEQETKISEIYRDTLRGRSTEALKKLDELQSEGVESDETRNLRLFATACQKKDMRQDYQAALRLARDCPDTTFSRLAHFFFWSSWERFKQALHTLQPLTSEHFQHSKKGIIHFLACKAAAKDGDLALARSHMEKALQPGMHRDEIVETIRRDKNLSCLAHGLLPAAAAQN